MGTPKLATPRIHVVMADGSEHDVQALNVDLVAWDRHRAKYSEPLPSDAPFVWLNYLAWHALKREGVMPDMALKQFEIEAVEVSSRDVEPEGDDEGVGPTPTDPGPG